MTKDNESPFPFQQNDPFNVPNTQAENSNDTNTLAWQLESQSTLAPRWQLLTDQEKEEQSKVINKLESKLKSLDRKKDKSMPNYTNQTIPDTAQGFHLLDSEEDVENEYVEEEGEEGLPLLWKNSSRDVDQIKRKTEDQYSNKAGWLSCFFCCK